MTIDEKVEQILPKVNNIPIHFWLLHERCFGKTDDDDNEIQFLYNYMTDKRLIEPGAKEEEYIVLTTFGYKILIDYNGWINYLKTKNKSDQSFSVVIDKSITQKVEISDSTITGGIVQSSDPSENKSSSEPKQINNIPINIKRIIKFIFWTLGAIVTIWSIYKIMVELGLKVS